MRQGRLLATGTVALAAGESVKAFEMDLRDWFPLDRPGFYKFHFEFDRENAYTADDVENIRKQLSAPGWSKFISSESKRDRELVEIYSWQEGGTSAGLAILVAEPMELTIVNIVGPIDLSKLPLLQGQFGIPNIAGSGAGWLALNLLQ